MAILIRNENVPVSCSDCIFSVNDQGWGFRCVILNRNVDNIKNKRPEFCPLIKLPMSEEETVCMKDGVCLKDGENLRFIPLDSTSIFGYSLRDLIALAEACRKDGVTEKDLRNYVTNLEHAYDYIYRIVMEQIEDGFKRCIGERSNS